MLVAKHFVGRFDVEHLCVGVERYHVVTVANLAVRSPPVRRKHFRILRQAAVVPRQRVPNLKARVLDARKQAVMGPVPREGQQVPAGFQHPFHFTRPFLAPLLVFLWLKVVPVPTHERQSIRRVGDGGVDAFGGQLG